MNQQIDPQLVAHVAQLSALPLSEKELTQLAADFTETLPTIENLQSVDVNGVEPTHQVTGLENITRDDNVDEEQMFSQKEALANAQQTHKGYFVVPRVLENKE